MGKYTISGSVDGKGMLLFDKIYMDARTIKYEGGIYKDAATGSFYMGGQWRGPRRSGTPEWRCVARLAQGSVCSGRVVGERMRYLRLLAKRLWRVKGWG